MIKTELKDRVTEAENEQWVETGKNQPIDLSSKWIEDQECLDKDGDKQVAVKFYAPGALVENSIMRDLCSTFFVIVDGCGELNP